jgi:streptogramin lyase
MQAELDVTLNNDGPETLAVSPSDFVLSVRGDMFGPRASEAGAATVHLVPHHSHLFRLTFAVPGAALQQATLFYRAADSRISGIVPLHGSPDLAGDGTPGSMRTGQTARAPIHTFRVARRVGELWGTAIDRRGNLWFAAARCDFAPTCGRRTPPGQIGEIKASSHAVVLYTLPKIPGNQPLFLVFDSSGKLWFTTPSNSKIGEFNPSTGKFIGQWNVTRGSGPWDLTIANRRIWYTEHLTSAVGSFNPATHTHRDFPTPSSHANPYGIAANGRLIWLTENNSEVDRVAVLDTTRHNAIFEYPIVLPRSGTPHMITIGSDGHPWWTEGWANSIATLNPAAATAGQCGPTSGTCSGIQRFPLPPSSVCSIAAHTSGIAFDRTAHLVRLDNTLSAQVGSFNPSTGSFALHTLSNCNAHPDDGLSLGRKHSVWFNERFGNAIGELFGGE